jgi:hypothetical protein
MYRSGALILHNPQNSLLRELAACHHIASLNRCHRSSSQHLRTISEETVLPAARLCRIARWAQDQSCACQLPRLPVIASLSWSRSALVSGPQELRQALPARFQRLRAHVRAVDKRSAFSIRSFWRPETGRARTRSIERGAPSRSRCPTDTVR